MKRTFFTKAWVTFCAIFITVSVVSSILVYLYVSAELTTQVKQRLSWEAKFYREQLDQVFLRAALRADSLVMSAAALTQNRPVLQDELQLMRNSLPSLRNSWIAYPNGDLILAPNTPLRYVQQLPWWRQYLENRLRKTTFGYPLSRSQAIVGEPFMDQAGISTLIPLTSFNHRSTKIVCTICLELDINLALTDYNGVDVDWSNEPVSLYTGDGRLIASPYRYSGGDSRLLMKKSNSPLIRYMRLKPDESSGFAFYTEDHQKMVGTFLRDPSLGMVVVVARPVNQVMDPVRKIAVGPLIVAALCLFIATLFGKTLYSSLRQLREAERLTRQAEFRALQAHINPHFLYNTLNQMVSFAVLAGNESLTMMMRSLTNLFRYTIRKPSAIVALQEELGYLQEYLALQQLRYGERFSFQLNVPDELLVLPVLKFCIQPLVENCFIHSVEKSLDPIAIRVVIEATEDAATVTVTDDGPGVSAERLREIRQSLKTESNILAEQDHSIGLANIHHRIRYTYGPQYGIALTSLTPGLSVCLRLPRQTESSK